MAASPRRWRLAVGQADGRLDWLIAGGFGLGALLLFLINLGGPALRDWDEGTVAQVAREIAIAGDGSWQAVWQALLHPTLWGAAYVNKPPLMHGLIALVFRTFGVSEWGARLPGALLSAAGVPLIYWCQRQLHSTRLPAVLGTMVFLTLLPVVRHGRLAMLDGAIVCFFLLTLGAGLRARRNLRWALGVGMGMGLMCLTKGVLGLLLGGLVLAFLAWDTPRLLSSGYLWSGLVLGLAPAIAWYGNQALGGSDDFVQRGLVDQALKRLWAPVENHRGSVLYYLGELLEWAWPWLMFLPWGLQRAWREQGLSWGKLVLVLGGGYFAVISLAQTKLPWYIMPLYPVVAIAIGPVLAEAWQRCGGLGHQPYSSGPINRIWAGLLALLGVVALGGSLYFGLWDEATPSLALPLLVAGLGIGWSLWLMVRRDAQWVVMLGWSWGIALATLMASPHWVFELGDDVAAKPMGAVIQAQVVEAIPVYTTNWVERPSLSFYSDRRVIPICPLPPAFYPTEPFYFWIQPEQQGVLQLDQPTLGSAEGWQLQGPVQFTEPTAEDPLRARVIQLCQGQ